MLHSVTVPGAEQIDFGHGLINLWPGREGIPTALAFAVFDRTSRRLPPSGFVEVELDGPLDGRRYIARRALDMPDHWQVADVESGWLAARNAGETRQWLGGAFQLSEEVSLETLFANYLTISVPVSVAWLLEDAARREAKLREWFRMQGYADGVRWLGGVHTQANLERADVQSRVSHCEGRDGLFDDLRRAFDAGRRGSLASLDRVTELQRELDEARIGQDQLNGLEQELQDVDEDLGRRHQAMAVLEAQLERWRHWQSVHERARRSMQEHHAEWQEYQDACVEVSKLAGELSGIESVRGELQTASATALTLQREEVIVEEQMTAVRRAETAAGELADRVEQQRQLEQQLNGAQERAQRLDIVGRALQQAIAEAKRTEVLLADADHQLAEVEQLSPYVGRIKKLRDELKEQERLLREASRQVDHLRFLEPTLKAISGHLDDLRKGASASQRLTVKTAAVGNGASDANERIVAGHLREAIENQVVALERELRDWQIQARELAGAPMKFNQLRATIHQLEQELETARGVEVKLGAMPALKQHRKYLAEHLDELKKTIDARSKEHHECADAPARVSQLRQDLSSLRDPRSQQQVLLRTAARKNALESELRQLRHRKAQAEDRQQALEEQLIALQQVRETLRAQEIRRDRAHDGYCAYVAQQAIVELSSSSEAEVESVSSSLENERHAEQQADVRKTALLASIEPLKGAPERVLTLSARVEEAEQRAGDWKERYQVSAEAFDAAEANRAELQRRRSELATRQRALALLESAQSAVDQARVALGTRLRQQTAHAATPLLRCLTGDDQLELGWAWAEAPTLVRAGASRSLAELDPLDQAYCALALRLALAADASRFRTVFISDLGPLDRLEEFRRRLSRTPEFDQILLPATA